MPYPGMPDDKETVAKMERCVAGVVAQGKSKESAIKICRTSISGTIEPVALVTATAEELQSMFEDTPDVLTAQGGLPTNAILKFEGACLARAEVNKNRDGLMPEAIKQLADSIRLMPLTYEHEKEPRGVVTRGRVSDDGMSCLIDGLIWAGHYPEFAEEVRNGKRKLSLDAEARFAVCGDCGTVFTNPREYCEHMVPGRSAVRWLHDLVAIAAGAVIRPAGTGTVFPGANGLTIISGWAEMPEQPAGVTAAENEEEDMKCPKCGHEFGEDSKASELQTALDEALSKLKALEADVDAKAVELEQAQSSIQVAERTVARYSQLAAVAGIETADNALDAMKEASDSVFQTLLMLAAKGGEAPAGEPLAPPAPIASGDEDPPTARASVDSEWTFLEVGNG